MDDTEKDRPQKASGPASDVCRSGRHDAAAVFSLVHLFDYDSARDIVRNVAGDAAMFIPGGIVLPLVYRQPDSFRKAAAAGAFISLCIEILQLPFASRASDIDDLILNTRGTAGGYGIYAAVRHFRKPVQT